MNIDVEWTTIFTVFDMRNDPVSGATIVITNSNGVQVFAGTTDNNGRVAVPLRGYRILGDARTQSGNYHVMASLNGSEDEQDFAVNGLQTIQLQLGT